VSLLIQKCLFIYAREEAVRQWYIGPYLITRTECFVYYDTRDNMVSLYSFSPFIGVRMMGIYLQICWVSYFKCGVVPIKCGAVPIKCGAAPIKCGAVTIRCGAVPIKCGAVPINCGAVRIKCGAVPIKCGVVPIKCGVVPMKHAGNLCLVFQIMICIFLTGHQSTYCYLLYMPRALYYKYRS